MNDEQISDIFNDWWKATGSQLLSLEWDAKYIAGSAYVDAFNRAAQLLRAADTPAIELLRRISQRHDNEMDLLSEESYDEIDAVLKTLERS